MSLSIKEASGQDVLDQFQDPSSFMPLKASTLKYIKSVFSNSASDTMIDHNGVLDAYKCAKEQKLIDNNKQMTLLHFDSHSDMYKGKNISCKDTIANYVNTLAQKGDVKDIYWVIPNQIKNSKDSDIRKKLFKNNFNDNTPQAINIGPKDETLYIGKDSENYGFTNKKPKDYTLDKYRTIRFHCVTIDELPSFKGKDNLMVDIDADYFSNSGHDTIANAKVNFGDKLPEQLDKFTEILDKKSIKPVLTTMALSPKYCVNGLNTVRNFFSNVAKSSKVDDLVVGYSNTDCPWGHGATILKGENLELDLINKLDNIDINSENPNSTIPLDANSSEYKAAIEATMQTYSTDDKTASRILEEFDKMDNYLSKKDNVINYHKIEREQELLNKISIFTRNLINSK